jgi:enoyl-[acyl-carrier protein] reductase/trans-2-enoyl-CoA reductase (NAD+)
MIIKPKIRGFICTTSHPSGCAANVQQQIDYVKADNPLRPIKNILIIGCSTGYGLATRIVAAEACQANTLGVMFEKPSNGKRPASAGWYNTAAFEQYAAKKGLYAQSINGDAFSDEIKQQTLAAIKQNMPGGVDLVIYSLASPRRTDPVSGETFNSVLKTVGEPYTSKTVDTMSGEISEISIQPANEEEIANTIKVMGGEDWQRWIDCLLEANALAEGVKTIAYSYIGPKLTYPIYYQGTIGKAKQHLASTAQQLNKQLAALNGQAVISVNKAVVTQASSAIPVVPLYLALLMKVMQQHNIHEDCIEQIYRLFKDYLCADTPRPLDNDGMIRVDDLEMRPDIQAEVNTLWEQVTTENINEVSQLKQYQSDFYRLFGFGLPGVDYEADVQAEVAIPSL